MYFLGVPPNERTKEMAQRDPGAHGDLRFVDEVSESD